MKNKKKIIILGIIIVLILLIVLLLINNSPKRKILGSWVSSGGTVYEFNKGNKGVMIVPLANYKFKYKIDGNKLSIDYESEKANDTDYEFIIENKSLTLKGSKGTFKFTRKK